jgi:hypothetical protein
LGYTKFLENEREEAKLRVQQDQADLSRDRLAFERDQETWKRNNPELDLVETPLGYLAVNRRTPAMYAP